MSGQNVNQKIQIQNLFFFVHSFIIQSSKRLRSVMQRFQEEEIYCKALLYRDNKVEGISEEESQRQAEFLFLQLAKVGHQKATHNYASIQFKKENYTKAYEYFLMSGLDASIKNCNSMLLKGLVGQIEIDLIVNSNRSYENQQGFSSLIDVYRGNNLDMSFSRAFGGDAVTCSTTDSAVANKRHIRCNPSTFDFSKSHIIKHALIFQVSSAPDSALRESRNDMAHFNELNYNNIGKIVENISKAMKTGAVLEIEWDPGVTLNANERPNSNPFHGVYVLGVALASLLWPHLERKPREGMDKIKSKVDMKLLTQIRAHLRFYHEVLGIGSSVEELAERVYWEANTAMGLIQKKTDKVHLACNLRADPQEVVLEALQTRHYGPFPDANHCLEVNMYRDEEGDEIPGQVYDLVSLMGCSYFQVILSSIAAENNTPEIVKYLQSVGFKDVTAERRTNEHNGRQNVWMVRAIRT